MCCGAETSLREGERAVGEENTTHDRGLAGCAAMLLFLRSPRVYSSVPLFRSSQSVGATRVGHNNNRSPSSSFSICVSSSCRAFCPWSLPSLNSVCPPCFGVLFPVVCARQQWVVVVNREDRLTTIDRLSLR